MSVVLLTVLLASEFTLENHDVADTLYVQLIISVSLVSLVAQSSALWPFTAIQLVDGVLAWASILFTAVQLLHLCRVNQERTAFLPLIWTKVLQRWH